MPSSRSTGSGRGLRWFAGVGDEAAGGLDGQIEAHRQLGWQRIELRTIAGVPLAALDASAFAAAARQIAAAGLEVVCVDSGIGGWARTVGEPFERDLAELAVLAPRLAALGTRYLRIMSYPNDGRPAAAWRRAVLDRVGVLAARAERAGIVLLHENCAGWAGDRPERAIGLLEAVASPALRLLFDTGNGVAYGYQARDFLAEVLPWVEHVHVKDGTASGGLARFTWPGEGSVRLAECLELLSGGGFAGTLSIEPHLLVAPHLGRNDPGPDGVATFVEYGRRLERLVAETVGASASASGGAGSGAAR